MALKIVWTSRAVEGYQQIIEYLQVHFTDKEIRKFIRQTNEFFELLKSYPELLEKSDKQKNLFRGPINKFTIVTYRYRPNHNQIELINIRSSRQKPK
ncbi:type II toxin-antitoxin system RelE/ParE family toxin [Cecembia sp.]|uniref:type II toxin-antitoxin system RelE/ParE family toxin n=1 Tax=Cecembia sp. TaxID=1898110 RepID=UPI00344F55B0